ncbi:cofilin/actin-depolymerizing factor homolog [Drosophila innubila]|uniref:cofilin/actin-depolymerizing factor homolog n=1 Tax=Drosophila innubila TaxID=198719 RepID=UPI00148E3D73|nr:cofilin/actin-depolymerizing factor homolog [Drosophila innubila]
MSVRCSTKCLEIYEAIRKGKKYRYIIFRITPDAVIDVETIGPRDNDYKQFMEDLMRNGASECRYGLFDLEYTRVCEVTKQQMKREKLVLLSWCPSNAKPKGKILYLSFLHPFMNQLKGIHYYKTVGESIELSRDEMEGYFH